MKLNISPTGLAITRRFFLAFDIALTQSRGRSIRAFTEKHDINYWNFSTFKKDPSRRALKAEWLAYIVEDFGVNADWLLTGVGNIFKSTGNPK